MAAVGTLILGIILMAIGGLLEPARPAINNTDESLIAIGLTFFVVGLSLFIAWAAPSSSSS